jgi:hypothetical protein
MRLVRVGLSTCLLIRVLNVLRFTDLLVSYGMVLAKGSNYDHAIYWLLKSVALYSWNWGAWLELMDLIQDAQHV